MIEFFGSRREFHHHQAEFLSAIGAAISEGQYLQGKEVDQFERQLARMTERQFGVAVNSCTDALYFALIAAGVKPGDDVMVSDFSFIASASCILRAGARPIFVDVNEHYHMDLEKAAEQLTPKTKALIYVHLYGQMADPKPIEEFCLNNKITLIEDAAQVIGSSWNNRPAGSMGYASCISFDPTKPISAPGSGGILLTNDEAVAHNAQRLRYHGRGQNKTLFSQLGFNSQMSTVNAAVLLVKLRYHEPWLKARRLWAARYLNRLAPIKDLILPHELILNSHNYHKFVIRTERREALKKFLQEKGIDTMVHYAVPLHRQPCFGEFHYDDRCYPNTIRFSQTVLSLPIYPSLSESEVDTIAEMIERFFKTK